MTISETERRRGRLTEKRLAAAVQTLREAGYVMIERVLPRPWVTRLRRACNRELIRFVREDPRGRAARSERLGHVSMFPPPTMPFMDPLALAHPIAMQIIEAVMGKDVFCTFYNTNTAWPGSGVQRIHRDSQHLFPEAPFALPVSTLVVNIPLVNFTDRNGSTELWPGSHLITDIGPEDHDRLSERASRLPSVRANMPAGSLVVRDMRLWHRGMPNRTRTIRTMLAVVYFRSFMHRPDTMTIPRDVWEQMPKQTKEILRFNTIR